MTSWFRASLFANSTAHEYISDGLICMNAGRKKQFMEFLIKIIQKIQNSKKNTDETYVKFQESEDNVFGVPDFLCTVWCAIEL